MGKTPNVRLFRYHAIGICSRNSDRHPPPDSKYELFQFAAYLLQMLISYSRQTTVELFLVPTKALTIRPSRAAMYTERTVRNTRERVHVSKKEKSGSLRPDIQLTQETRMNH